MTSLSLQCHCGTVSGRIHNVSAANGNHVICYCDDCQAFARHLGQADDVLDAQGGTQIYQTSTGNLELTKGHDQLACLKLSPKGIVRWYAGCCNMPIGNTLASPALPFIGLVHTCLHDGPDGASLDTLSGPVQGTHFTRFAKNVAGASQLTESSRMRLIARFARLMLMARLRGDHKRSPFFGADREPVAVPHLLTEEERSRAYGR